jgi:hypothetical protein
VFLVSIPFIPAKILSDTNTPETPMIEFLMKLRREIYLNFLNQSLLFFNITAIKK